MLQSGKMTVMKTVSSPEQQKFFLERGYIEFEKLISLEEAQAALAAISTTKERMPHHPLQQLIRATPYLLQLIRKKELAKFAYELTLQSPLRIAFDKYAEGPFQPPFIEQHECGLLLYLHHAKKGGSGIYYQGSLSQEVLLSDDKTPYLLFVFSNKQLHTIFNPIVFKK